MVGPESHKSAVRNCAQNMTVYIYKYMKPLQRNPTPNLKKIHALFCCVCYQAVWLAGAVTLYKNNRNGNVSYYIGLSYSQLNCIECTSCFVVCAVGLCSYVPKWNEMLKLGAKNVTKYATIVTTKLHQMHALFCCVCAAGLCSWLEQYTKLGKRKFVLVFDCIKCHIVVLFDLLDYIPNWNQIQQLGKVKIVLLNLAIIFTTKLH